MSGVLRGYHFLTTNRINSIDIAVQSRMQLAIQYRDLTTDQKLETFKTLLSKIPDEEISNRDRLEKGLKKFCARSEVNIALLHERSHRMMMRSSLLTIWKRSMSLRISSCKD